MFKQQLTISAFNDLNNLCSSIQHFNNAYTECKHSVELKSCCGMYIDIYFSKLWNLIFQFKNVEISIM